jgi:hypothetical protein
VWINVLDANLYPIVTNDVKVIADSSTETIWVDAVQGGDENARKKMIELARVWDLRLEFLLQKRMVAWGNVFCEASGVRLADNPVFGVWSFESNWLDRMLNGEWRELPEFFIKSLCEEWNNWIYNEVAQTTTDFKEKYSFLVKGESVEEGTLKLMALEQHPTISENELWFTLGKKTRDIFLKSPRAELQREFFVQLYLKHIARIKNSFIELGSITRDAPYFISMSTNSNVNIKQSDIYSSTDKMPYVVRYNLQNEDTLQQNLSAAKQFLNNGEISNASIIMFPHDDIMRTTPFNLGVLCFANSTHPFAIKELGFATNDTSVEEKDFKLSFAESASATIEGIKFELLNNAPNEQITTMVNGVEVVVEKKSENNPLELSIKFVKIKRKQSDKPITQIYLFLSYDEEVAKHVQLYIHGSSIANNSLVGECSKSTKESKVYKFDKHGEIKLPLNRGYSVLLIEKQAEEFSLPFDL